MRPRFKFSTISNVIMGMSLALTSLAAQAAEVGFKDPYMIETLGEFPIYSFYLGAPSVNGVAYLPHAYPKIGPRIFMHGIGVAATLPVDLTHDDDLRGHTEQSSFIISPFRRSFGFDFYYQSFKGLYEDNPITELNAKKPARYPLLPDATVRNFGINSYFALNSKDYSLAAAFVQTEFQTVSGGSWLIEPFYNNVEINTGTTFVASSDPTLPQTKPDLQWAHMITYGLALGYGHAWISGKFYFSLLGGLGAGYQSIDVTRADGTTFSTNCAALKGNFNGSMGFNLQNYVIGIKGLLDSLATSVNKTTITSSFANAQFYLGARF